MSKVQDLQERVAKATEKVEKCKATIARHEAQLAKKVAAGVKWEIESKQDDIKGATRKLKDAEEVLSNWQAKLNVAIEQERFIEGNAPQVIKDFLEQWKQMAHEWHVKRYADYQVYKKELSEKVEQAELEYYKATPDYDRFFDEDGNLKYKPSMYDNKKEKYLKEKGLDYRTIKAKEANFAGAAVLHMCTFYNEAERLAWLEKELEREKQAKLLDLVQRINAVVGTITNAEGLRISAKGNLDGVILGTGGNAEIHTIGAGGWNVQCFHYRTLVHKL